MFTFLFLVTAFFSKATLSKAEIQQNVLVNCLDYYIHPEAQEHAGEPAWPGQSGAPYVGEYHIWNGITHILMLKNKPGSLFTVGKPIYVMRNNTTGYAGDPAGHEAFCALDQTNSPLCTADMMQPNSIKSGEGFRIVDQTSPIMPDAAGNLTLPHVRSYTPLWSNGTDQGDTQFFYGVQILDDSSAQDQTNAVGTALKLGTFAPTGTIPNTTTNCVSIWWDPAGKVIDAKTLEPVLGTTVTLHTLGSNSQKTLTQVPRNPFFVNPQTTGANGSFTFAVDPGTYVLNTVKEGFSFPIEPVTLQNVRAQLERLDPTHEYADSTKLYNDPNEEIIETAGITQFRYMVMNPTDPNYPGSEPVVLSSLISLAPNGNQIIQGTVSHPKGIVKAAINGSVLAQTTAGIQGNFTMEIAAAQVPANPSDISITEEKVPLIARAPLPASFSSMLNRLVGIVYAQTETRTSKPLLLKPIPSTMTGFAYSQNYKIMPNAKVNIIAFGSVVYATGRSDANGFVSFPTKNLPPFGYTIEVRDSSTEAVVNRQTPDQFITTNKTYAAAENVNYYRPVTYALPQPQIAVLAKVQAEADTKSNSSIQTPHITTDKLQQTNSNFEPTTVPQATGATASASFNNLLPFFLLIGVLVVFAVGILVVSKMRSSGKPLL